MYQFDADRVLWDCKLLLVLKLYLRMLVNCQVILLK